MFKTFQIVSKNLNRIYVMECNKTFCGFAGFYCFVIHTLLNIIVFHQSFKSFKCGKDIVFKFHQSILHTGSSRSPDAK